MDPISRSAKPFCHGERGAIGLSRMPTARRRCRTIEPKTRSRSRMRYPGADSQGKASVIWRAIHSAVGVFVTPIQTSSRRSSPNDDEAIEQAEGKRRHEEKIHRREFALL